MKGQWSIQWCVLLLGLCSAALQAQTTIKDARIWSSPDRTRLVFELGEKTREHIFTLKSPDRVVIDFRDARLDTHLEQLDLAGTPVRDIRSAPRNRSDYRVVLDLRRAVKVRYRQLPANSRYGYRLVLDLGSGGEEKAGASVLRQDDSEQQRRAIIVVIDAGHGGSDPGAIGPDGVKEKNVTLGIARDLRSLVATQPGFEARMTRTGDYFIPLRKRIRIARRDHADLFVSIHADSFPNRAATGASVYALSEKGASSETARWLAHDENQADLMGGAGNGVSLADKGHTLAGVLLDLSMTAKIDSSLSVGHSVLQQLAAATDLHRQRVEQAAFVVLKAPDVPSILVETGFISNPHEEHALESRAHQQAVAFAIFKGVLHYFSRNPPAGTLVAWEKKHGKNPDRVLSYRVQAGDTLSGIAQQNEISVNTLRRLNNLDSDMVQVGQVLRIPAS